MKSLACLLLLLHCTAVTVSQSCSDGEIEIFGVETDIAVAGRLEICVDGEWFAVYDEEWSKEEAMIACEKKGFPREGGRACNESCFGNSSLVTGYHFTCEEETDNLLACERRQENCCCLDCINIEGERTCCPFETDVCFRRECHSNAGVICVRPDPNSPSSECPAPQRDDTSAATSSSSQYKMSASTVALSVLSVTLFLTLVGMVVGWVWFCHRTRSTQRYRFYKADTKQSTQSYMPTFSSCTSAVPYVKMKSSPCDNELTTATTTSLNQRVNQDSHQGNGGSVD